MDKVLSFYEELADFYHLLFDDWNQAIDRQARVLGALLACETHDARDAEAARLKILDCACGIGTQSLGLARLGHRVLGSDLSPAAVARARREAKLRSLVATFQVADMTDLSGIEKRDFDVVVALDNALPHLSEPQLAKAARSISARLKHGGLFLASIRDYDALLLEQPKIQQPVFYGGEGERRIVHQVWDWIDDRNYAVHQYITIETADSYPDSPGSASPWRTHHFTSKYRALRRAELSAILAGAGFRDIRWLMPADSGFYQPLVIARSAI